MNRPVSGLLIIAFATPSHIFINVIIYLRCIEYSGFVAAHSYRCGGSTGISPVSRFIFISCVLQTNSHPLKRQLKTPKSALMLRQALRLFNK
jgi:hypothetical protein